MTTLDERLLEKEIQGIPPKAPVKRFGLTGYTIKGVVRVLVYKDPSRVHVRFPDGTMIKALHNNKTDDQPDRPVNVVWDEREGWKVESINNFEAGGAIFVGGTGMLLQPHVHVAADITDLSNVAVTHSALPTGGLLYRVSGTTYGALKFTVDTVDPTVTDDESADYAPLSFWLNTSTGSIFDCLDATEGAAVWVERGSGASSGSGGSLAAGAGAKKFSADGAEMIHQVVLTPNVLAIPLENELTIDLIGNRIYNIYGASRTITRIFASVDTAPDGDDIIIDVLKNGVSILNSLGDLSILDGANTGNLTSFDDATWDMEEYLQIEITQVGTTTPGSDLTVHIAVT